MRWMIMGWRIILSLLPFGHNRRKLVMILLVQETYRKDVRIVILLGEEVLLLVPVYQVQYLHLV